MPESSFYARRAEQELERARRSTEPAIIQAHYELAALHLSRLDPQLQETIRARVARWNSATDSTTSLPGGTDEPSVR